jgi:hypothetical protein
VEFSIGSSDDFHCFDYAIIIDTTGGKWLVLHSTINSKTGGFIEDGSYRVISFQDYDSDALGMVREALEWCRINEVKHDKRGWNQDPFYFHRAVHTAVGRARDKEHGIDTPRWPSRQLRHGGKRINRMFPNGIPA